jgi:hypothetical protein
MFFSRAALEFMVVTGREPDVLHLHDWQSSTVVSGVGRAGTPGRRRVCLDQHRHKQTSCQEGGLH